MRYVLVSFTPAEWPGGVNRWNRDFMRMFPEFVHYSWWDVLKAYPNTPDSLPEWEKAKVLSQYLLRTGRVSDGDVVIADSFWADGYDPAYTYCVRHGIWSHLTKEDVDAGKQPEFPQHHAVQVAHTRKHLAAGGKVVAVSDFIADQLKQQWGWDVHVINNAVDLDECKPIPNGPLNKQYKIIHGSTTANKGLDHIEYLKEKLGDSVGIFSLDEAAEMMKCSKMEALATANLVVHPSAYEGNSMFVLESLACDVPVVSYDVGLMWLAKKERVHLAGVIGDRRQRSPQKTLEMVEEAMSQEHQLGIKISPRSWVSQFSLQNWKQEWVDLFSRGFL